MRDVGGREERVVRPAQQKTKKRISYDSVMCELKERVLKTEKGKLTKLLPLPFNQRAPLYRFRGCMRMPSDVLKWRLH